MFANFSLFAVATALLAAAPIVVPTGPAAPTRAPTNAAPTAKDVADGIQKFYDGTAGFAAQFIQVVKKRGLKKGITRKGQVYLKKGRLVPATRTSTGAIKTPAEQMNGQMRWDYPAEEIYYFSDGEVLWTYERRERLAVRLPVKNSRLYQATSYLVGQGNLGRDFKLELVKAPLPGTLALKLIPKSGTQTMRSLTLVVDSKTFAVRASVLIDPLGDSTTLKFDKATYGAIADKVFAWTPPKGVRIKKL